MILIVEEIVNSAIAHRLIDFVTKNWLVLSLLIDLNILRVNEQVSERRELT